MVSCIQVLTFHKWNATDKFTWRYLHGIMNCWESLAMFHLTVTIKNSVTIILHCMLDEITFHVIDDLPV